MARFENNGHYELQIINHAFNETSNGNPKIDFECRAVRKIIGFGTPNEHRVEPEQSPYTIIMTMVFGSEKQREINIKKLRYAGWNGVDFDDFNMVDEIVVACNKHNPSTKGDGKVYDQFDMVLPALAGRELEDKPSMKKKMNSLLAKELRANAPESSGRPAGASKATTGTTAPNSNARAAAQHDEATPF